MEYADLAILDFSKLGTPEGRVELAATARRAMHEIGFFYITNHGLSVEQARAVSAQPWMYSSRRRRKGCLTSLICPLPAYQTRTNRNLMARCRPQVRTKDTSCGNTGSVQKQ